MRDQVVLPGLKSVVPLAEPALVVAPEPKRGRGRPKKNATVAPPAEPEQVNVQDRPILRARRIHK
jgi:hypothetical protein